MGKFSPIPEYINVNVSEGYLTNLNNFISTVHNAGQAYLYHTCGHESVEPYINPDLPDDSVITVTSGSAATTGCTEWEYSVDELTQKLLLLEATFKTKAMSKSINANDTTDFLLEYFQNLCRIYGQKFSYYSSVTSSALTTWAGIGLLNICYLDIDSYKYRAKNTITILDQISDKQIITSSVIHDIINQLMQFNASFEIWKNHGQRNEKSTESNKHFLKSWGADHSYWIYYWEVEVEKIAAEYAREHGITQYTITHEVTGHWGYVTYFDSYINYSVDVLIAQNPVTTNVNIH